MTKGWDHDGIGTVHRRNCGRQVSKWRKGMMRRIFFPLAGATASEEGLR